MPILSGLLSSIAYKLPAVQGKKSSSIIMLFSIIIAAVVAPVSIGITSAAATAALDIASSSITSGSNDQTSDSSNGSNASSIQSSNTNQQKTYNATQTMMLAFKTADSLLTQALNNLNTGKTKDALMQLNNAKVQIEQYQLAALDAMSNPVLQLSRAHLLAAQQALKTGNTDKAISELNMLRQLRLLHQQGMMRMNIPMAGDVNSTFNSLESHLLAADENINGYNIKGAISQLSLANDQLYAHQLSMLGIVYSFLNNARTHLNKSTTDISSGNIKGAISELRMVDQLLRSHGQGMLMMVGRISSSNSL
jgi:hypothetical protein